MRPQWMKSFAAACLLACAGLAMAQEVTSERERFRIVTVTRDLDHPWSLAFLPDGRMLVTERDGNLRYIGKDGKASAPIANVPKVFASGQGGLLDVVPDAGFANNQTIYLSYAEAGQGAAGTA